MPRRLLPIRWLGDRKIFQGRFKALWLKLWGAIPVDRDALGSVQPADIQRVVEFAERGKCIGVFPECCLVGGPFGDPHRDLVVAALDRRICVLPVGLMGNAKAERSLLPKTIDAGAKVIIGDPLREASELLDSLAS